jgi:glycine dehydrogenase
MKTDLLADRHIGIQEEDLPVMLEKIGVKSLDELINKTIPSKIRLKEPLPLAAPMTEREFAEHITELASQNKIYTSYIGMGWYDSITPAVDSSSNEQFANGMAVRSDMTVWKFISASKRPCETSV